MAFEKDPIIPLKHILQSIRLIERWLKGVTFEEFEEDIDLQDIDKTLQDMAPFIFINQFGS